MKIIQKILSHGLLIAIVVAVFFGYRHRQELFPQWFEKEPQSVAAQSDAEPLEMPLTPVAQPEPEIEQDKTAGDTVPDADLPPLAEEQVELPPLVAEEAPPVAAETAAALPPPDEGPAESPAPVAEQQPAGTTVESGVTAGDSAVQQAAAVEMEQTPPTVAQAPAPAVSPQAALQPPPGEAAESRAATTETRAPEDDAAFQAQLTQAREYFWRRDVRAAVQAYTGLTESHPDQADPWGELGNLYFGLGRWTAAADAYYQATLLLIEQGEVQRARYLLRVMHGLDSKRASELETHLKQAGG
jgi:tetratricopeptide (TPR) repeat protein